MGRFPDNPGTSRDLHFNGDVLTVFMLSLLQSHFPTLDQLQLYYGCPLLLVHPVNVYTSLFSALCTFVVVRPEKPASEELCYRLISHIDPRPVLVSFAMCWTSCVAPHVCVLRTQLPTPSLNYSVDDSSRRRRRFTCLFFRAR